MDEKKRQVTFVMDGTEYLAFKKLAIDKQMTVKDYLINLIRNELEANKEKSNA